MMRTRLVAGGAALALAAVVLAAPASHAASSSGTSQTTTRVLEVELGSGGSLLGLRLLGEEGAASTVGTPTALARLRTFDVSSKVVSALNLSGPVVEASSGGAKSLTPSPVDLAAPAGLLGGRIVPGALTAVVDGTGARAGLQAAIEQLGLAGGLVSVGNVTSNLGAAAVGTDATGTRGLEAGAIKVVDLGALLAGLGIPLADLPVGVVSDLLGGLGLSVPALAGTNLESLVGSLSGTINGLTALLPAGTLGTAALGDLLQPGPVTGVVDALDPVTAPAADAASTIGSVAGSLSQQATDLLASVGLSSDSTVQDLVNKVNELTSQLTGALTGALQALDVAPLLSVDGIKVGVTAKAASTVESSLSEVTATVGSMHVGGLGALPGLDLLAPAAQLSSLLATVQSTLDGVLATIDPVLAGVVKVTAFEKSGSVTPVADGTKAVAGLTALTVTITPPADLAGLVQAVKGATGIGDLLGGAGLAVPALDPAMTQLTSTLGGLNAAGFRAQAIDIGALAQGGTIRLGSVQAASAFGSAAQAVAPAPSGNLPRTGAEHLPALTALAVLLIALGLGLPVWSAVAVGRRRTSV